MKNGARLRRSLEPASPKTLEQVNWVRTWPQLRLDVPQLLLRDRYRVALLGLAVGDALGTTLEFRAPGTFKPITDMIGGGPFGLQPGQWTDDTAMALCLAESLIEKRGFDPKDQMDRYCRWWKEGYLSSTGTCSTSELPLGNDLNPISALANHLPVQRNHLRLGMVH